MNTTILQLVAIYNIQLHVSALYVGHHQVVQPDDGLHIGPKHVVVNYILLLIAIVLCSWLYAYIDICTLQVYIIDLTQRGWHTLRTGPDDGLHTGPKHVVVYYILLLIVILLCSWLYAYIDICTLQVCIIDLTQRGWHTLRTGCESTFTSLQSVGRNYVKTSDVGWNIKTKIHVQKIGFKNVHLIQLTEGRIR